MGTFIVNGGKPLKGEITPQGAKNEALEVICATLLTSSKVTINNIPNIADVNNLIDLLESMGVTITRNSQSSVTFEANNINIDYLVTDEFVEKSIPVIKEIMEDAYRLSVPLIVESKFDDYLK